MTQRTRHVDRIFRFELQAILMPTYKGGDQAIKLLIRDGYRGEIQTEYFPADVIGQMNTTIADRLRALGYELVGNDRWEVKSRWHSRSGCYIHLLKESKPE